MRWLEMFRRPALAAPGVRAFDSPTAEVLAQTDPTTERGTLYLLALMVFVLGLFISLVKIDRVVTATGRLVPISGGITVQPLETQIISRILVGVGDVVKKGQVLAVCDPTFAQADRTHLEQQLSSLEAETRRMTAEEEGRTFVADPAKPYDALQAQIFAQRRAEYRSGVADFDQRISAADAQVAGLHKDIDNYKSRLKLAGEMEGMHSKLAKDGYVSRLQWLTVQDQQVELTRQLSDAENTLTATVRQLDALKEQRKVYIEKWRDDNLTALVTARNAMEAARQDLAKAERVSELVNLVAPADGIVTRVPSLSTGGVATGAQPLFNLVPVDAPLEARVQIDAQDVGFIKVGDPVNIKFDSFKFLEHGVGHGKVKTISQDSFTEASTQDAVSNNGEGTQMRSAFYDARVSITDLQLHDLPSQARLLAGMTLNVDIVVGQRTILWYLLGGAMRSGSEAMREP
jgi:HlyD family type I secretion membrane fusion protein